MTPQQREDLEKAIVDSFSTATFEIMLILKLGINLEQEVGIDAGFRKIVNRMISVSEQGEWTEKLILKAYEYRPVKRLEKIINDLSLKEPLPLKKEEKEAVFSVSDPSQQQALEKIVNKQAILVNFVDHLERLKKIGSQICRIEFPEGKPQGTGWLVASNLILTNYHVVDNVIKHIIDPADITCRFDFFSDSNGAYQKIYKLATNGILDWSSYALSDIKESNLDPTLDELDYALLRLSGMAGEDVLTNGSKRNWIVVPEKPVAIMPNDIMLIPQHPLGRSLELAFGNIFQNNPYNDNGTRLRYNANTDYGSSGSPCFDINLAPFGLHHAGRIKEKIGYNQCVPLREIIKRMIRNNVQQFWTTDNSN